MLKQLAKKLARVIAPLVFKELIIFIEDILKADIDGDGHVGKV